MLTLFELCPHPGHSPQRANEHISFLDRLIRAQQLTLVDAADPEASRFASKSVPVVQDRQDRRMYDLPKKCSCPRSPLDDPVAHTLLPSWASVPPWEPSWGPAEVEKEECRRLCWSALSIVSCQSVTSSAFDKDPPDFFLSNPANVSPFCPSSRGSSLIIVAVRSLVPWRGFSTRAIDGQCCRFAKRIRVGPALPKYAVVEQLRATKEGRPRRKREGGVCDRGLERIVSNSGFTRDPRLQLKHGPFSLMP